MQSNAPASRTGGPGTGGHTPDGFRALRVEKDDDGVRRTVARVQDEVLPAHGVTVEVAYSSLNYKDALSATGNRGVTRNYPHTPGIDAVGTVSASDDPAFGVGERVICTGFDLGMDTPGGFGERIRVPASWLVPLPDGMDERQAMGWGTAGFTAAMALAALRDHGVTPELGPLVVTGASGGVGTLAVGIAAALGYEVVASSGSPGAAELLRRLGASRILPREALSEAPDRPLLKGAFAGGVDTVGGATLASLLKQTVVGGAVAACGAVGGSELPLSVFPFILRGVALLGIDSQHCPRERREEMWRRLADPWRFAALDDVPGLVREVGLEELEGAILAILEGRTTGRIRVRPTLAP